MRWLVWLFAIALISGCGRAEAPAPERSPAPRSASISVPADAEARLPRALLRDSLAMPRYAVFAASWCAPCQRLADSLRRADRHCAIASSAHILQLDTAAAPWPVRSQHAHAEEAARHLGGVYELPTLFLLSPAGGATRRIVGVPPVDSLCTWL